MDFKETYKKYLAGEATDEEKQFIRELKCEGITSQVAIINNYERVGMRFSFYATLYKN